MYYRIEQLLTSEDYARIADKYIGDYLTDHLNYKLGVLSNANKEKRDYLLKVACNFILTDLGYGHRILSESEKMKIIELWLNDEFWKKESDYVKRAVANLHTSNCITIEQSLKELERVNK